MKRLLAALALCAAGTAQAETLSVAATPVPHAELLEFVKPQLAAQGVELQVRVFTDYVQPNLQVQQKRLDANFFQHQPYLDEFNASRKTDLVAVTAVHIEPFGAYSRKFSSLAALPEGASVAIPSDATNGGRALLLLAKGGLIGLREGSGSAASPRDIVANPKHLRIRELEAATLPRVLGQVDLALINTNYALEAGLDPRKDALLIEGSDSPYVNILVARPDNRDSPALQKLAAALHSDAVKQFIADKYRGAVLPAF